MKIIAMKRRIAAAILLAPALALASLAQGHDGHAAPHAVPESAGVTLGDLTLSHAFTRAMPPNAPVAGGFLTVANGGAQDDRLVAARSDLAAEVQIHEMTMNGSVMKMRELPEGLPIPAGQTVELKPGGYHLMFIGVIRPFAEGQTIPLTLSFEQAGEVALQVPVGPMNARSGGQIDAGGHSGH